MFVLELREASASLRDQDEIDAVIRGLSSKGYKPTVRSMVSAAFEAAGAFPHMKKLKLILGQGRLYRPRSQELAPLGDVFFCPQHAYVLQPTPSKLKVWSIRYHSTPSAISDFCKDLTNAATTTLDGRRLRGMDFTWKESKPKAPEVRLRLRQKQRLKSKEPDYTETQSKQAQLLTSFEHRNFLITLAQVRGKARSIDTESEAGEQVVNPLLEAGLVNREYLVICRQDSHTICGLSDKTQLEQAPGAEMKCTICGRSFKDELVQDIFALSQSAKSLLNQSSWMTIWITDLLKSSGMNVSSISWNATSGEDEVDIIADIHGTKVFFELKDREFGVGDAYPFLYRIERYGGSYGVVLSTDRIAEEVKKLFSERGPGIRSVPIKTAEGVDSIKTDLPKLINKFSQVPAISVISELSESIGINLVPILHSWMNKVT